MASLQFQGIDKLIEDWTARRDRAQSVAELIALEMGHIAENEIHPLTHKITGNWDRSIHTEVESDGTIIRAKVVSHGAFASNGFNYGPLQEALNHPIEIGFYRAIPEMIQFWEDNFFKSIESGEVPNIEVMDIGIPYPPGSKNLSKNNR